jgi:hypothetical protein
VLRTGILIELDPADPTTLAPHEQSTCTLPVEHDDRKYGHPLTDCLNPPSLIRMPISLGGD